MWWRVSKATVFEYTWVNVSVGQQRAESSKSSSSFRINGLPVSLSLYLCWFPCIESMFPISTLLICATLTFHSIAGVCKCVLPVSCARWSYNCKEEVMGKAGIMLAHTLFRYLQLQYDTVSSQQPCFLWTIIIYKTLRVGHFRCIDVWLTVLVTIIELTSFIGQGNAITTFVCFFLMKNCDMRYESWPVKCCWSNGDWMNDPHCTSLGSTYQNKFNSIDGKNVIFHLATVNILFPQENYKLRDQNDDLNAQILSLSLYEACFPVKTKAQCLAAEIDNASRDEVSLLLRDGC